MTTKTKIGLALGSGAARGWVHVGVLKALDELGVEADVLAGTSAGALVAGAKLLGILPELEHWARELGPLGALKEFSIDLTQAGLINPDAAFDSFRHADKLIEELPLPLGIVATDLATGEEVRITKGSVIDAVRASSAIPMIINAAKLPHEYGDRWLLDGALSNPVPVDLARELGADKVIAVDVNAKLRTLERFDPPETREVILCPEPEVTSGVLPPQVSTLVTKTRSFVSQQVAMAKARIGAKPHFFETAVATMDIYQAQLSRAKMDLSPPEILIAPDTRAHPTTAFDKPDELYMLGYEATMAQREAILAL